MMEPYRVFIEESAVDKMSSAQADIGWEIRAFILSLADDPFNEGDFTEYDQDGQQVFSKVIDEYCVDYCVDHAVKEVKVFDIVRAD